MESAIVILGAAVWAGGRPSPALARRIGYGLAAARRWPEAPVFCSGGVGRHGPSEARVMADRLIAGGIAPERVALDELSTDTLENVVAAAAFLRGRGLSRVILCTDGYHQPRARMMLRALGVTAAPPPALPVPRALGLEWWRMALREGAAYPYDAAIMLWRRRALLREVEARSVQSAL